MSNYTTPVTPLSSNRHHPINFILLPPWVKESLLTSGKSLSSSLNIDELLDILSFDDVSFYYSLNLQLPEILTLRYGMTVGETFSDWCQFNPTENNIPEDFSKQYVQQKCLDAHRYQRYQYLKEGHSIMEFIRQEPFNDHSSQMTFDLLEINENTYSFYPVFYDTNRSLNETYVFIDKVLSLMMTRWSLQELAHTRQFHFFLKRFLIEKPMDEAFSLNGAVSHPTH